jgi:hypothetical protein
LKVVALCQFGIPRPDATCRLLLYRAPIAASGRADHSNTPVKITSSDASNALPREVVFGVIPISFYSKELWRAVRSPVHVAEQNSEQKRELKRLFKTGVRMSCGSLLLRRTERCHCFAAGGEPEMARKLHQVFGFSACSSVKKSTFPMLFGKKRET